MKGLIVALICLLTLYAPLELTRYILVQGLRPAYVFELCMLWSFYFVAIIILTKVVKV